MTTFWRAVLPRLQSRTFLSDLEEECAAQQNQTRHPQVLTITQWRLPTKPQPSFSGIAARLQTWTNSPGPLVPSFVLEDCLQSSSTPPPTMVGMVIFAPRILGADVQTTGDTFHTQNRMSGRFDPSPEWISPQRDRKRERLLGMIGLLSGFLIPFKAFRFDVAGLSLYAVFLVAAPTFLIRPTAVVRAFQKHFGKPLAVLFPFAVLTILRGLPVKDPVVTGMKLVVGFFIAAVFVVLLKTSEKSVYRGLFWGVAVNVLYMTYQYVSSVFFGFRFPYTSIAQLKVGFGLSQRYGLARVTGFSEEPSFIATLLVGSVLLLYAYAKRTGQVRFGRWALLLGLLGLCMSTSNNLFATIAIVGAGWPLVRRRTPYPILIVYYGVVLVATPILLNRDLTYYARFSSYDIFLRSSGLQKVFGHGVGSYIGYFREHQVNYQGIEVASLASLWGSFLFEGGIVLAGLVIVWVQTVMRRTGWREGFALFALLIMLSNFNSPWWPVVSLAFAQCTTYQPNPQAKHS
jgi:hypothetical protein